MPKAPKTAPLQAAAPSLAAAPAPAPPKPASPILARLLSPAKSPLAEAPAEPEDELLEDHVPEEIDPRDDHIVVVKASPPPVLPIAALLGGVAAGLLLLAVVAGGKKKPAVKAAPAPAKAAPVKAQRGGK
jgi:hypothetical protein